VDNRTHEAEKMTKAQVKTWENRVSRA
jgi:hypothetical protein